MYRLIYMKADFEPWWLFDGWEEAIVSEQFFETKEACEAALHDQLKKFRARFENETCKNENYYAFWNEDELEYCEACDEDTQLYHGLFYEQLSYIVT